jgi:hypothetical protein
MNRQVFGMLSSYKGLNERRDWLWKQTPQPFGVWDNIQMIANESKPDFLLLYQYDFPKPAKPTPWWKNLRGKEQAVATTPLLLGQIPKERTIYLLREPPLEEIVDINRANYRAAEQYCGYISGPDRDAPTPDYMPAIWYVNNTFRELNEMGVPVKTNPLCWITSGISRTANHRRRLAFIEMLRGNNIEVDLYGRGLPDRFCGLGSVDNKWNCISPYYYNLAIENYAENDLYVSEKLWDALLGWCLPIYYGGSAADKLLPKGSFLRLPSLDEKGIAYIKDITSNLDAWHEAKEKIAEARQIILHELNLLKWLSDYAKKI